MKRETQKEEYLFLFADLKDSTSVAIADKDLYKIYMSSFHWAVTRAKYFLRSNYVFPHAHFRRIIQNIEIIGDEVFSYTIINNANESEKEDLIASSVSFLYMLELYWLASPINLKRLKENMSPHEISAGLHIGNAHIIPSEFSTKLISYNINMTKGIQETAKSCTHSSIYATNKVRDYYNAWRTKLLSELKETPKLLPPLVYAGFENGQVLKVRDKDLELWELSLLFNQYETEIDALFREMSNIEDKLEYQAEMASIVMSTNFLICRGNPFRYSDGRKAINGRTYESAKYYIEIWFKEFKNTSYTFINSSFMALNYLIISGSFSRHPEIEDQKKQEYQKICQDLYNKMKERYFDNS
jgi:hypothetical protein